VTITLINSTRRMKVINLPHAVFCAAAGACACLPPLVRGGRRLASSLTLPAGSATTGLSEALLRVPEVARDLQSGELRLRREAADPRPTNPVRTPPRRAGRKSER
jgi:hypothetical protein